MKKKLTAALLAALMTLSLTIPASAAFTDVPRSQWYYNDVTAVEKYGIIEGVGGGRFAPDDTLTLAQAITMAARVHAYQRGWDNEAIRADYFADTGANPAAASWFQPYLYYAKENGICNTGAYGSNYDGPCSRLVMAKLFARVVYKPNQINHISSLPDTDDRDVLYLYNQGILTGNDKYGTFAPDNSIKRSETAAIVNRVLDPAQRKSLTLADQTQTLILSDYLGLNVGYLADRYGWEFEVSPDWWYGASKAIGHPSIPFTFLIQDNEYRVHEAGDLMGWETITMIQASSDIQAQTIPGLPTELTLAQLRDRLPGGDFYTSDEFMSDDGAEAQYIIQKENIYISYQWFQSDPNTQPADWVSITLT